MSLRDELLSIRSQYGQITPATVLDAARAEDHPLHSRFEWDESTAAEQYRLVQAAELIRKVKITYADAKGKPQEVRAFVVVRGEEPSSSVYQPTDEVLADPFQSRLLLQEFEREWKSFKSKYEHLKEFAAIIVRDIAA